MNDSSLNENCIFHTQEKHKSKRAPTHHIDALFSLTLIHASSHLSTHLPTKMNAENIGEIWTDDPDITPSSPTNSFECSVPPPSFCPPQFDPNAQLTGQQKKLVIIFLYHQHYENEVMNTVVDLDIDICRERDEPGVKFVIKELENMQRELVVHREGKRRAGKKINVEEERLSRVVRDKKGDEKYVARRQLREMKAVLEKKDRKEWKVECLR